LLGVVRGKNMEGYLENCDVKYLTGVLRQLAYFYQCLPVFVQLVESK
jgi:hypothetical protein